jgi:ATP-dependent HslUV protease subunit HslV
MVRATTVVGVVKNGQTTVASDGQVTMGEQMIIKSKARKVHRLASGKVLCGFAGAVADAQALLDRFEGKLEAHSGSLKRAAIDFAKDWRTDKVLRNLNAMMVAADGESLLLVGGDGNVMEPDDGVIAVGSGGAYALAAARALVNNTELRAEEIAREALRIAGEICVFTNDQLTVETLTK